MQTRKAKSFRRLVTEAAVCTLCPGMCERAAVLSDRNGPLSARIMFIGEAPGRKGADQTRVPFSGDESGKNFDRYLASIGLNRNEIFITSAAICNPRSVTGANRKPTRKEISNCSYFLTGAFEIINPEVVVTLGSVALDALKSIQPHALTLRESAAQIHPWNGRLLVPVYHPSPQVLASHRRDAQQLQDYRVVAKAIDSLRSFQTISA
jgi:uracil-DNA glycosylase